MTTPIILSHFKIKFNFPWKTVNFHSKPTAVDLLDWNSHHVPTKAWVTWALINPLHQRHREFAKHTRRVNTKLSAGPQHTQVLRKSGGEKTRLGDKAAQGALWGNGEGGRIEQDTCNRVHRDCISTGSPAEAGNWKVSLDTPEAKATQPLDKHIHEDNWRLRDGGFSIQVGTVSNGKPSGITKPQQVFT